MSARFSAARVWAAIEDWLIPTLRLSSHERSLYYHLLRRTRLAGRRAVRMSRREAACVSGLSLFTAWHCLRQLAGKRCIRYLDHGLRGCLLEVRLPGEIAAQLVRASAQEQLALAPHVADRDLAGQPRAWPRSDRYRGVAFRRRILQREGGRCFYCRRVLRPGAWSLDHVVPVARGGSDVFSNVVSCCLRCNSEKALTPADEFLRQLRHMKILTSSQLRARLKALGSLSLPQP